MEAVKGMMAEIMGAMMPFMMYPVYIGAGLLVLGILMLIIRMVSGSGGGLVRMASMGLILIGIFFLGCQVAGLWLGANPSINFGDPSKFEFNLYPFWQIGLALFIPGVVLRMMSGHREVY